MSNLVNKITSRLAQARAELLAAESLLQEKRWQCQILEELLSGQPQGVPRGRRKSRTLTKNQSTVLQLLQAAETPIRNKDLAAKTGLSSGGVSGIAEELISRRLVVNTPEGYKYTRRNNAEAAS